MLKSRGKNPDATVKECLLNIASGPALKQHPCCCHQKPLYFQSSCPKLPAVICRSARPMCIDVQMLIWALLQRTHSSLGKLRVAAQRPWSPSRTPTHPSYFFRSASVFKWSLAWFARSVTIETKEKKALLTGRWQRGWAEGGETSLYSSGS